MWGAGVVWVLVALLFGQAAATPLAALDGRPRGGVVSELGRLAARARPTDAAPAPDARLPLPTPQELDAIKKVAQILVMLGEQIIPTLIGDGRPATGAAAAARGAAGGGALLADDESYDPGDDS